MKELLWKNGLQKMRSWGWTLFDILVPFFFCYNLLSSDFSKLDIIKPSLGKGAEARGQFLFTISIPLSFFLFFRRLIGNVVTEKERGLKDYLQVNGANPYSYLLSFVLSDLILVGIVSVTDLTRSIDLFIARNYVSL